jgi:hypothetical protein
VALAPRHIPAIPQFTVEQVLGITRITAALAPSRCSMYELGTDAATEITGASGFGS